MAEVILSSSGRRTILCKLLIFLLIFCVHTKVSLGEEISEPLNIDETVDVLAAEERLLEILQGIQDQEENQEKLQRSLTKRSKFSNVLLNSQNDPEITPLRLEAPQLLSFSTNNGNLFDIRYIFVFEIFNVLLRICLSKILVLENI